MEAATESTHNINSDLNLINSNKGQSLLIMNQYIYKCNKKGPIKNIGCVVKDCGVYGHTDIDKNYLSGGKTDCGHPANPKSLSFLNTTFFMNPYSVFDIFCRHFYCRPKFRDSFSYHCIYI